MSSIEKMLTKQGYYVINQNYPSTTRSVHALARDFIPQMVNACLTIKPVAIHFVTHSLGGIILQHWLKTHTIPHLSRVIMLSPPNHGSPIADLFKNNYLYKKITGPAGQELLTTKMKTSIKLYQKPDIGVIAGNRNFNPFSRYLFKEDNDGKVSVLSAKTDNMLDFIVLPVTHTFMMNNKKVKEQILYFLRYGKFI